MTEEPRQSYFRRAVLGPIGIPIAVLIGVAFMIVNLSRVLLAVNKNASVVVAIGVALVILLGCTLAAARTRIRGRSLVSLLTLFALGIGTAGAVAAKHGERKAEKVEAKVSAEPSVAVSTNPSTTASASAPAATGPVVTLAASNFAFNPTTLQTRAGGTVTIRMTNNDVVTHNWALYSDQARTQAIFNGDPFAGPNATHDYTFPAPAAGTYYFRCDIHPTMTGTLKVA